MRYRLITLVGLLVADTLPAELVAVTIASKRFPTYLGLSRKVFLVALLIVLHALPLALHTSHLYL